MNVSIPDPAEIHGAHERCARCGWCECQCECDNNQQGEPTMSETKPTAAATDARVFLTRKERKAEEDRADSVGTLQVFLRRHGHKPEFAGVALAIRHYFKLPESPA